MTSSEKILLIPRFSDFFKACGEMIPVRSEAFQVVMFVTLLICMQCYIAFKIYKTLVLLKRLSNFVRKQYQ
jgi:hypothetical protein